MCVHVEGERETQGDTPLMSSAWKVSPLSDSGFENPPPHFTCSHHERFNEKNDSSVEGFRSFVWQKEADEKGMISLCVRLCVSVFLFVWCLYVCAAMCVWR
jgi:hypothetical protein